MVRSNKFFVLVLIWISFLAVAAEADRKAYVWTYQYITMPKGELELEMYLDYNAPQLSNDLSKSWRHQLELEYGLTDRWDVSIYQVFKQNQGSALKYDEMKLRTRYRFGEAGDFLVDPLLYLEYKVKADRSNNDVLEAKGIIARDFYQANASFNLIYERELASGAENEWEYTFGFTYQLHPTFFLGIENVGNFESGNKTRQYLGPTMSLARGKIWFNLGSLWGLSDGSDDFRLRYIMGIEL